ncbi:hypothetical protein CC78DRAFT_537268 [Lojkania enalia]|uniref:Uncharacterized protein n=1 Tax=Lojkania enalia TaxID=147567 RepID=A0A9P4K318_9PLEO|nr:hypothetical protein CC78DRAFT_537268 [Didymosphaeria enalia]
MPLGKRTTFYLYDFGMQLDQLCIGNLVLKGYKDPMTARHYTHPLLDDNALKRYASIQELKDFMLVSKRRSTFGVAFDLAELANLGIEWGSDKQIILAAKSGRRIEVVERQKFFDEEVFPKEAAKKALRLWLSAAATNNKTAFAKMIRKPHVWLLTGAYILEDARVLTVQSREPAISAGVSPTTIGALTMAPVGGSFEIGTGIERQAEMVVNGACVWAAQWTRLDVKYYWPGEKTSLPKSITLLNTFTYDHRHNAFDDNDPRTYIPPERITACVQDSRRKNRHSNPLDLEIEKCWIESESEDEEGADEKDS